jgi:hypothetical protein
MVFAECRLVLFEAETPQPTPEVHVDALIYLLARNDRPGGTTCLGQGTIVLVLRVAKRQRWQKPENSPQFWPLTWSASAGLLAPTRNGPWLGCERCAAI